MLRTYRTRAMLDRGLYCFTACFLLLLHLKNKIKTHLIYENKQGAVYIQERVNMARVRYSEMAMVSNIREPSKISHPAWLKSG